MRLTLNKIVVTRCRNHCQPIEATRQIMTDILREVRSLINNLAMSRIPHYLIPLSHFQNVLTSATKGPASPIQTHLAFSLCSAIPFVMPRRPERHTGGLITSTFLRGHKRVTTLVTHPHTCVPFMHKDIHLFHGYLNSVLKKQYIYINIYINVVLCL